MHLLDSTNENIALKLQEGEFLKSEVQLYDFDGYSMKLSPNRILTVYPSTPEPIASHSSQLIEHLSCKYHLKVTASQSENSIAVYLPEGEISEELCQRLSSVKRDIMSFPLVQVVKDFTSGQERSLVYRLRSNEKMYLQTFPDKILVTLGIAFEEPSDETLAKIICQVTWKSYDGVFDWAIQSNQEKTIASIGSFRNNLHYHIKCTKAFIHSRMNAKTAQLLCGLPFPEQ